MVHYWLSIRLSPDERSQHLDQILQIMGVVVPTKSYNEKPLCQYLLPHALEIIDQAEDLKLTEKPLARLMQVVAYFLMWVGINAWSVRLSSRALEIGQVTWRPEDISLVFLRKYKGRCLERAARHGEAVTEYRKCLEDLATITEASDLEKAEEQFYIRRDLVVSLSGMDQAGREEAANIQQGDMEESKRRIDLAYSATSNDDQALGQVIAKHNYCNSLIRLSQFEEAASLVDETLVWAETSGKSMISEKMVLPWYNSRGHVLAGQGRDEEALAVYTRVMKRSAQILSIDDDELWVAYSNVSSSLFRLRRFNELQQLVSRLMDSIPESSLDGGRLEIAIGLYNYFAISYQKQWTLGEAERLHRVVLEWDDQNQSLYASKIQTETGSPSFHVYIYNLCLCLARQQKHEQVQEIRMRYGDQLQRAESIHGTIIERLRQDAEDVEIYESARKKMVAGDPVANDSWFLENKKALERGEDRFGPFDTVVVSESACKQPQLRGPNRPRHWMSLRKLVSRKKKVTTGLESNNDTNSRVD